MIKKYLLIMFTVFSLGAHIEPEVPLVFMPGVQINAIHYLVELLNVAIIDSKNKAQIKFTARASYLKNMGYVLINLHKLNCWLSNPNKNAKVFFEVFTTTSLAFISLIFASDDDNIIKHAKAIVQKNKQVKDLNIQQQKKHIIWLICNMLLPSLGLALKQLLFDTRQIKKAFSLNNDNTSSKYLFELLFNASLISEKLRQLSFYKYVNPGKAHEKTIPA